METLVLISLVGLAGYYLNNDSPRTKIEQISNINDPDMTIMPLNEKPNSLNIYNSNMVSAANNDVLQKSLKNYNDSIEPSVTGVLPAIYNSYTVGKDPMYANNSNSWKELSEIDNINKRNDINTGNVPDIIDRPMFKPILNLTHKENVDYTNFGQGTQDVSLLTGLPIEREHDNMVPFFGGNVRQNVESFTNSAKLDHFTGNTSTYIHKSEPLQRFENVAEIGINGTTRTPALTDNIDTSRFIPSRFKQNQKPFLPEQVPAPIAFTEDSPITAAQISQPTIDTLRTSNNAQISYTGRVVSGSEMVPTSGKLGSVSKHKVNTSFELGHDRLFKGPGAIFGAKQQENFNNLSPTSRQDQNTEYFGVAVNRTGLSSEPRIQSIDNSNELNFKLNSIAQSPKRMQLPSDTSRNIISNLNKKQFDYGRSSINSVELERDTTSQQHSLNVNKSTAGTPMSYSDLARKTMKQTTVQRNTNDTSRNMNTSTKLDSHTGMTTWDPKTTQKETLLFEHKGQINKKDGMGYVVANYDAQTTNKETTLNTDYIPQANSNNKSSTVQSTFKNPQKVRYAVHAEDYKGSGGFYTSQAENREQFKNANISNTKEQSIIIKDEETYRGTNSSMGKIQNNSIGTVKIKDNMLLKEQDNTHVQNKDNISNIIPNQELLGANTKQSNQLSQYDNFNENNKERGNRFNAIDIQNQLKNNPLYNLK